MKKQSLHALGAVPAKAEDLPPGLLDDLQDDGISVYKVSSNMPTVLHEGRYRLYQNPDGGLRIQYRRDDKETDDYVQVPGAIIELGKAVSEGNLSPIEIMRRMASLVGSMRK
jgi:hypothetical protein